MTSIGVFRNVCGNVLRCGVQNFSCRMFATKWRRPSIKWKRPKHSTERMPKVVEPPKIVEAKGDEPIEIENPFLKEKPKCLLCRLNIEPNYKNVRLLSQFQSRYTGRIYEKHITGLCQHKQEALEREIIKAQNAGLMGCFTRDIQYAYDPPLFDCNNPFRSHKY